MENCTIYSHYLAFDKVEKIVREYLPKAKIVCNNRGKQKSLTATIKSGFFGKPKVLKINYRERETPSYTLTNIECGLTQNLAGMVNFIQSFPAANKTLQNKFVIKVMAANSEMAYMADPIMNEDFRLILRRIAVSLDAFIFAQPSGTFDHSQSQHFIDKHFKLILDPTGASEIKDIEVSIDSKYRDQDQSTVTASQKERKERSEQFLSSKGIKINAHLPCSMDESQAKVRTKAELIYRAYALLLTAARGEGIEKHILDHFMETHNVPSLSPQETRLYHADELTDSEKAYATWRYESLNVLLWAMGKTDLAYPSEICNVPAIVEKIFKSTREVFTDSINVKSSRAILDELDKTYRMNWACVDARINNQQVGGGLNPSVIYERHYALNWLINHGDAKWDDVDVST